MKKLIIILAIPLIISCQSLTKQQMIKQGIFYGATIIDIHQTDQILSSKNSFSTISGMEPERNQTIKMMAGWIILQTLVTCVISDDYRDYWQGMTTGVELSVIVQNQLIINEFQKHKNKEEP